MPDRSRGILLDSSVIIAHFRKKLDLFDLVAPDEVLFMPVVVLGELYKGAYKSANSGKHLGMIGSILKVVAVLNPDDSTAESYGRLSATLEAQGNTIPENDIWIAAIALDLDMPLATRDAHFERVPNIQLLRW
ncbi:MAG: PIN domain-containing protein [Verrucomicrobium sp.]|nr:PIN domain-containing protein [Verrucomicrobium sp.]